MGQCQSRSRLAETHQPKHHLPENGSNMRSLDSSASFDGLQVSSGRRVAAKTLPKPYSGDDFLALTYNDDEKVTPSKPLPSVRYSPGLEYDLCFPPFVKDAHRTPQIDDILGTYDVLISAPGGSNYRRHLTISSDDEVSLLMTREDNGRIKFELVCQRPENRFSYMGWTCLGDASIEYNEFNETQCMKIYSQDDPYPENYMGERSGRVYFVDQRGATFYAGKDDNREKTRCQPLESMVHAEKKLADFTKARYNKNYWIHRRLGLPVEVAAEVQQFLMPPMPPPVFFFEKGDLVLGTYGYDDSWTDVVYVARKRPRHMPSRLEKELLANTLHT